MLTSTLQKDNNHNQLRMLPTYLFQHLFHHLFIFISTALRAGVGANKKTLNVPAAFLPW